VTAYHGGYGMHGGTGIQSGMHSSGMAGFHGGGAVHR